MYSIVGRVYDELRYVGLYFKDGMRGDSVFKHDIVLTGFNPPGGEVLAQLQLGSLHELASQE